MKYNRVNTTLTFSVALAGLALSVLTPVAYGHGNNPKNTSDTEPPNTDPYPPGPPESSGPPIGVTHAPDEVPTVLESILDPGIVIAIDVTIQDAFNALSQLVSEPVAISMAVDPADNLMPPIDVDFSGGSGSGSISAPSSGVIPAPGTLVLLGLAAASAGRRRRRH